MSTSAIYAAMSGLGAQQLRQRVSTHNVVNSNTDGFKVRRASLQADAASGVSGSAKTLDAPNPSYTDGTGELREASNVSLAEEMVTQSSAELGTKANAKVLPAASDSLGFFLDVMV